MNDLIGDQQELCSQYDASWIAAADRLKVGIAPNVRSGLTPINGLRRPLEGDTSGWYIWAGEEFSDAPDFFEPMHLRGGVPRRDFDSWVFHLAGVS